ncbi:MAG: helicase-related protein [Nitrososphaerota archaeon]
MLISAFSRHNVGRFITVGHKSSGDKHSHMISLDKYALIKRGSIEARDYQINIAAEVGDKNSLVILPTGLGKTVIASLILASTLQRRGGKALFLAPTRIIVQQHKDFLVRVMNLPADSVVSLTGEDDLVARGDAWQSKIICATPQITLQDFKRKMFDPSKFSIVIFDEVHRATGNHSYVSLAQVFADDNIQKVGMTATLPTDKQKIDEIRSALRAEAVLYRDYLSSDVQPFVQKVYVETKVLEPPEYMDRAIKLIKGSISEKMSLLEEAGYISKEAVKRLSFKEVLGKRDSILGQGNWNHRFAYLFCAKTFTLLKYLETQTFASFLNYYSKSIGGGSRVSNMISRDARISQSVSLISDAVKRGEEHPKLLALKSMITALSNSDRVLIFAGYRETVDQIYNTLSATGIRAWILIGKQGETGQTQDEQVKAVEDFRKGNYQVLIATQIGEEGLDIAECNIVLFYDNVPSAIRYIQRRGRTGRRSPGRMIVLMVKGTSDEAYHWIVQRRLGGMRRLANKLNEETKREAKGTLDSFV